MLKARRRSRLQPNIQGELIKHFVASATTCSAAALAGVNRHTATQSFHKLRQNIAERMTTDAPELLSGEIEVNESWFGGARKDRRD